MVQEGAVFLKQSPQGGLSTVRVDDGTSTAATGYLGASGSTTQIIFTGLYNGIMGDTLKVTISAGTFPATLKASVYLAGSLAEIYDRIPATGSVAALIAAMNIGGAYNAPSNYIIASAGTSSTVELTAGMTATLAGGTDGTSGITSATLLGTVSGAMRTGMQALSNQGMDVFWLAGCTDSTTWSTMLQFARTETSAAIGNFPLGTSVATAVSTKASAGADDPYLILMLGFAVYFDTYLGLNIYIPSAGVLAGVCCSVLPHVSPGNKKVYGLLGTDKTYGPLAQTYSDSDEATLQAAGIDFIADRIPSANALGIRHGKNSSSNIAQNEIAYTRKTNDIVRALSGITMGQFVDQPQSTQADDPLREAARAAGNGYFAPQIGNAIDAYTFTCDLTNNPVTQIKQGIMQADAVVAYLANVNRFIINVTGGQSVDVQVVTNTPLT
jgi:hypothetical protein